MEITTVRFYEMTIPTHIEINGQSKPTTNSNGKLIHNTLHGIKNFWHWFGNSKVVDSNGRPLVLYHGTAKDFPAFSTATQGDTFSDVEVNVPRDGFWFTPDASYAHGYSNASARTNISKSGQHILSVYLKILNPFKYTMDMYETDGIAGVPDQFELESHKHDGIFVEIPNENEDNPEVEKMWKKYLPIYGAPYSWPKEIQAEYEKILYPPLTLKQMNYVAFEPNQIKSATGNSGNFSNADDLTN